MLKYDKVRPTSMPEKPPHAHESGRRACLRFPLFLSAVLPDAPPCRPAPSLPGSCGSAPE